MVEDGLPSASEVIETRQTSRAGAAFSASRRELEECMGRVAGRITQLDEQIAELDPHGVHGRIDELFPEDLTRFVDARQAIVHVFGLPAYADVMNEFAAGDRYLNRSWSASVDGYVDEMRRSIALARAQFQATRDKLATLRASRPDAA